MGSPTVFTGSRTKFISSKGALLKDGSVIDNDGVPNFIKNGHAEIDTTGWSKFSDQMAASTVAATDYVWITTSDLAVGDAVSFPSVGTSGLTANTIFYVIEKNISTLKVSTAKGGAAFNITGDSSVTIAKYRPIDGAAGSANITWLRSTTNPLAGAGSFTFAKDAANRMGEGVSYAFTIDPSFRARVINVQFDYILDTGTFAAGVNSTDSDVIVYLYDVTNSTLIEPSSFKLLSNSTSISDTFQSSFQTSATGSNYRLIFYVASASASAYTLKFDNIQVTPTQYAFGTPVTDWVSYTPTLSNSGNATSSFKYRRIGDSFQIKGEIAYGSSVPTGLIKFTLPNGFAFDASKHPLGVVNTDAYQSVGKATYRRNSTSAYYNGVIVRDNTSTTTFFFNTSGDNGVVGNWDTTYPAAPANGDVITIDEMIIPILGLSSSVQMSDQTSTRVVAARAYRNAAQTVTTTAAKISFDVVNFDDVGGWSGGTYTVKVPGKYRIKLITCVDGVSTDIFHQSYIFIDGVAQSTMFNCYGAGNSYSSAVNELLWVCNAGTTIEGWIRNNLNSRSLVTGTGVTYMEIERISGPNQIAASEQIVARYTKSDASAFNGGAVRLFGNKVADTHGAYNTSTGLFTAPIAGFYHIDASVQAASASYVAGGNARLYFSVAGSTVWGAEHVSEASVTTSKMLTASQTVYLLAGQTLGVVTDSSPTVNFAADATRNSLAIFLVK